MIMELDFRYRRIEEVIFQDVDQTFSGDESKYSAFGGRLRYQRVLSSAPLDPECRQLLDVSQFSANVRQRYRDIMRGPAHIPSGIFEFTDFGFFGPSALPLDIPTKICVFGSAFNFETDF